MEWVLLPRKDDRYYQSGSPSCKLELETQRVVNQWDCEGAKSLCNQKPLREVETSVCHLPSNHFPSGLFFYLFLLFQTPGWGATQLSDLSHLSKWYPCSPSWSDQEPECHFWQFSFLHSPNSIHHQMLYPLKYPLICLSIFSNFSPV